MTVDERRLLRHFRALSASRRQSLIDYAEFLLGRESPEEVQIPQEPLDLARPEQENVVKAIKRLRETYPMIDRAKILHEVSALMTQHLVHGKAAVEIIDELEVVFRNHYLTLLAARPESK